MDVESPDKGLMGIPRANGKASCVPGSREDRYSTETRGVSFGVNVLQAYIGVIITAVLVIVAITLQKVGGVNASPCLTVAVSDMPATAVVLDLPAPMQGLAWADVLQLAAGGSVNFAMWGGDPSINDYVTGGLWTQLLIDYNVTVNLVPLNATSDAVDTVAAQLQTNSTGTIDLIWINGANFKNAIKSGLLYGPWAPQVPSGALFNWKSPTISVDFGVPVSGMEMPYNVAQFVLVYDSSRVVNPPRTIPALVAWIKANPFKFAFPPPSDANFEASCLLRHFFYEYCGPWTDFLGPFNEQLYSQRIGALWPVLQSLQPYLWVNTTTNKPPGYKPPGYKGTAVDASAAMSKLYGSGDIWMTFSYDAYMAANKVDDGYWPQSTRSYVFDSGTISNTNFVAIPRNAPNLAAALVAGNAIASPEQMFLRAQPKVWGAMQAYDPALVPPPWNARFGEVRTIKSINTPNPADLALHQLGELNSDYGARLQNDWAANIKL